MLGRGRRDDRQMGGPGPDANNHYKMRQGMVTIGDDFWIEKGGVRAFKVDGKALRVRQTLRFEDPVGRELCNIQERIARIKDTMEIEDPAGRRIAMIKKALITPIRERWSLEIENGPDMEIQGNLLDHEYSFELGGRKVAEVSKRWFRIADSYGVEIQPGQNDILILAATVAVDMMAHPGR
jgi:uncharacterized protein YxjI